MTEFPESSEELVPKPEAIEPAEELAPQPGEESPIKLSQPSRELAIRLLERVNIRDGIIGMLNNIEGNNYECHIFSLNEAIGFLEAYSNSIMEVKGITSFLDPNNLRIWVGEALGDRELAEAIGEKISDGSSYKERRLPIKELMEQRLKQCKEILAKGTKA